MLKQLLAVLTEPRIYIFILSLIIAGIAMLLIVDRLIMPAYTNHNEGLTVPDVTHMSIEEAETRLADYDLRFEITSERTHEAFPENYVVGQTPGSGHIVKPNRKIFLTINKSETSMVEVPDLANQSLRNAEIQLRNRGLRVGSINYESERFQNTVLEQSIAGGRQVERGATVDLVISDGLGGPRVSMPDINGLRLSEAQQELQMAQLRVGRIEFRERSDVEPNIVLSYRPSARDSIREGQEIDLIVSEEPSGEADEVQEGVIVDTTDVEEEPPEEENQ